MTTKWKIVRDCDDDNGNPTCWSMEINHEKYGRFIWITENGNGYSIEVDRDGITELNTCKTLTSAKRWVSTNLI